MAPMLADDTGWLVALGTLIGVIGTVITGVIPALIKLWRVQRELRQQGRTDAIAEWREFCIRLEGQIERQSAVISQDQEALDVVRKELADCREDRAKSETAIHFLYDHLKGMHGMLRNLGHDAGDLPELPELSTSCEERDRSRAEFLARQAQQSALLVKEAAKVLPPPPDAEASK